MHPEEFFVEFVYPNFMNFYRDNGDKCFAQNACISMYHFHEYVYEYYKNRIPFFQKFPNLRDFNEYLRYINQYFKYIEAVALICKHVSIDHNRVSKLVKNVHSIIRRVDPTKLGKKTADGGFRIDFTKPGILEEHIDLQLLDGQQIDLLKVCTHTCEMWGELLVQFKKEEV